jgi:putative hydrolase of the HAD superfamily
LTVRLHGAPVTAVLFDYGNTLISIERPERALHDAYTRIAARLRERGLRPPAVETLIRRVHDRVDAEFAEHQRSGALEEIDITAAAGRAYRDLGLALDAAMLDELLALEQEAWREGLRVDPEAVPTLSSLRAMGLAVGLCSNAPFRPASMREQLSVLGLLEHLDAVTFSAEVGYRKPSPAMFEAAVGALGAVPSTAVMVGDSMREDIRGAAQAGLRAVLIASIGEVRDAPDADAVVTRLGEVPALFDVSSEGTAEGDTRYAKAFRRSL